MSEESVLKWYKDGHSAKGKMHFLEQMKKFIEWLQSAEEGKHHTPIQNQAFSQLYAISSVSFRI